MDSTQNVLKPYNSDYMDKCYGCHEKLSFLFQARFNCTYCDNYILICQTCYINYSPQPAKSIFPDTPNSFKITVLSNWLKYHDIWACEQCFNKLHDTIECDCIYVNTCHACKCKYILKESIECPWCDNKVFTCSECEEKLMYDCPIYKEYYFICQPCFNSIQSTS